MLVNQPSTYMLTNNHVSLISVLRRVSIINIKHGLVISSEGAGQLYLELCQYLIPWKVLKTWVTFIGWL